ncbi:hypothetical protein HDV05_003211 [Chytridiales sp. JEL 0842]|nr:hypothetical protein HDV05_003211 [Chytridiales sp. JEL 0842]
MTETYKMIPPSSTAITPFVSIMEQRPLSNSTSPYSKTILKILDILKPKTDPEQLHELLRSESIPIPLESLPNLVHQVQLDYHYFTFQRSYIFAGQTPIIPENRTSFWTLSASTADLLANHSTIRLPLFPERRLKFLDIVTKDHTTLSMYANALIALGCFLVVINCTKFSMYGRGRRRMTWSILSVILLFFLWCVGTAVELIFFEDLQLHVDWFNVYDVSIGVQWRVLIEERRQGNGILTKHPIVEISILHKTAVTALRRHFLVCAPPSGPLGLDLDRDLLEVEGEHMCSAGFVKEPLVYDHENPPIPITSSYINTNIDTRAIVLGLDVKRNNTNFEDQPHIILPEPKLDGVWAF